MLKTFVLSLLLGFTFSLAACESDPLTSGTAAVKPMNVTPAKQPQTSPARPLPTSRPPAF